MQRRPGSGPALEVVDLDGEEFDFVPGVEFGGAGFAWTPEERGELLDGGAEGGEPGLLDGGEGALGDDEAALEVVDAVDEDEDAAVVDVAEGVLGVGGVARDAHPEDVDGDALFDDVEVGGGAGGGVAAIAADGERGVDLGGAVGGGGEDAGDFVLIIAEEAGGFPAHAEVEGGELGGFGGEKVEEVPLGHEGDVLGYGGKVGEVGHEELAATDGDGHSADFGVGELEEAVEQAELVEELEGGGVDGVAAEVAEEVGVFFEDGDGDAGAGEEVGEHDAGGASADDADGGLHGVEGSRGDLRAANEGRSRSFATLRMTISRISGVVRLGSEERR
jgi:hypothetical protein